MTSHFGDPLHMLKKHLQATAGVLALALPIMFGLTNATPSHAQSQPENTAAKVTVPFEMTSIKLDKSPLATPAHQIYYPNRFVATLTARALIEYAYGDSGANGPGLNDDQIEDGRIGSIPQCSISTRKWTTL
jgi:hypothetical protein